MASFENSKFTTPPPPPPKRARITTSTVPPTASRIANGPTTKSCHQSNSSAKLDLLSTYPWVDDEDPMTQAMVTMRRETILSAFGSNAKCLPCLCRVPDDVRVTDDFLTSCQALDSVNNSVVNCTEPLSSNTPYLSRSHVRDRFKALCDSHTSRLRRHQCCPGCGVFCVTGRFNKCRESDPPHYFHINCANELNQCPHCLSNDYGTIEIDLTFVNNSETIEPTPSTARITTPANWSHGVRQLLNIHNELAIRRHTHRLSGANKEICTADLADPEDREAIRKAITEVDVKIDADLETLESAIVQGDLRLLVSVLAKNVDPDSRLSTGLTPIQYAANVGLFLMCYVLISLGANIDMEEPETGRTALMMAAINRHYGICKLLVRYGKASYLKKDRSNDTALHLAAKAGAVDIVCFLIYGTNLPSLSIDAQDSGGWTSLMWAAENGHTEAVKVLLEAGAKTGVVDSEGNIALHWAAMSGSVDVGRFLLMHNCEDQVNKQNTMGHTPLIIACRENHSGFIELLLANGADPTVEDVEHKTAEMYIQGHVVNSDNDPKILLLRMMEKMSQVSATNRRRTKRGLVMVDLSKGRERNRIYVFNEVDDEPVDRFIYITAPFETSPNAKVDWHITPDACSCSCIDGCGIQSERRNECLCSLGMGKIWYDENGRLVEDFPFGTEEQPQYLFECNPTCHCPATCRNRVVQHGIAVNLKLMRTADKGWGVFADEDIRKGTFICEYAGELITDREAEERNEDVYLFELSDTTLQRSDQMMNWLCLDSYKYGNISRFINHGCECNLFLIKVFYDHVDARAPHVAFFAARDICKNEELTFDYGPSFWGIKGRHISCKCRSPKCLYGADKIENFVSAYSAKQQALVRAMN